MTTNKNPVERIYPTDKRVKLQTIAHHKARYKYIVSTLGYLNDVLDLGCGTGYGTDILASKFPNCTGVDISDEAIAYASKNYPRCKFEKADILQFLKKDKKKYGLITMFETIEHLTFKKGKEVINLCKKHLKNGGIFILSTPRDSNEKYNLFHKSEWSYDMLKNELGSVFNIKILGQDWDTAKISSTHVRENDFYIALCYKIEDQNWFDKLLDKLVGNMP